MKICKNNKLLCLSIDSNSYTTLYTDAVDTVDEAVKTLLGREANDGEGLTVSVTSENDRPIIEFSDEDPKDKYFVSAEVFPMPTKDFIVVYWHAYDGVGFDIIGSSDSLDEARKILHDYVQENIVDIPEDYREGDASITADNGNGWEMLQILHYNNKDIKEVA